MLVQMVSSNQGVSSVQPHLAQPHSRPAVSARVLKESPSSSIELQIARLRRDAANAVAVLLEDDACKQEVGPRKGLQPANAALQPPSHKLFLAGRHALELSFQSRSWLHAQIKDIDSLEAECLHTSSCVSALPYPTLAIRT